MLWPTLFTKFESANLISRTTSASYRRRVGRYGERTWGVYKLYRKWWKVNNLSPLIDHPKNKKEKEKKIDFPRFRNSWLRCYLLQFKSTTVPYNVHPPKKKKKKKRYILYSWLEIFCAVESWQWLWITIATYVTIANTLEAMLLLLYITKFGGWHAKT